MVRGGIVKVVDIEAFHLLQKTVNYVSTVHDKKQVKVRLGKKKKNWFLAQYYYDKGVCREETR